jgi:hypothetical protein
MSQPRNIPSRDRFVYRWSHVSEKAPSRLVGLWNFYYKSLPEEPHFFHGIPYQPSRPIVAKFHDTGIKTLRRLDCLPGAPVPLCTARFRDVLLELGPNDFQFLPAAAEDRHGERLDGLFLINVIAHVQLVDRTRSKVLTFPNSDDIMSIIRHEFHSNDLLGHAFAREELHDTTVYVSPHVAAKESLRKFKYFDWHVLGEVLVH